VTLHEVKCWPEFFGPIRHGSKTFEVRDNDRNYQQGDTILLRVFDPTAPVFAADGFTIESYGAYTGSECTATIGYVAHRGSGPLSAIGRGYVVFSLLDVRDVRVC
jgi:hypothetical protein